ncbi:MAG: radical SAM protein [archaeon]|jgi:MoaA/NifB/PqqE/SkfB family radical SAM enzyme
MISNKETNKEICTNIPYLLTIRLLKKCTAKCTMCNFWKSNEKEIPFSQLKHIIDEAKKAGIQEICFTGGEPTLYPKFFELVEYLISQGLQYSFITNGSLLTKKFVKKILLSPPRSVYISIDSPNKKMHDSMRGTQGIWEKAFKGIILFNSIANNSLSLKRPKIIINYIVTNKNYMLIPDMIALSKSYLFDEINLMQIKGMPALALNKQQIEEYNSVYAPKIIQAAHLYGIKIRSKDPFIFGLLDKEIKSCVKMEYSKQFYQTQKCSICDSMIFVETNGAVFPCNNTPYYGDNFYCGNIFENNLSSILSSKRMQTVKRNMCGGLLCTCCDPINQKINLEKNPISEM